MVHFRFEAIIWAWAWGMCHNLVLAECGGQNWKFQIHLWFSSLSWPIPFSMLAGCVMSLLPIHASERKGREIHVPKWWFLWHLSSSFPSLTLILDPSQSSNLVNIVPLQVMPRQGHPQKDHFTESVQAALVEKASHNSSLLSEPNLVEGMFSLGSPENNELDHSVRAHFPV